MNTKLKLLNLYLARAGLRLGAIVLEADKLDAIPEYQRAWYAEDPVTKKFKLDPSKVDVEDTGGLRSALQKERAAVAAAKAEADRKLAEALAPFEGIDPKQVKELMAQFASAEEREAIKNGHIDEVIKTRMQKEREALSAEVAASQEERDGALEVASTFMERVLDNAVFSAAVKAGLQSSAIDDALLRARSIFSLDDDGNAVQFEEDGETVVLGKDGKTPYSPGEWLEEMREKAPHWFPAGNAGGGAPGSKGAKGRPDLSGLSPVARMTAARAAKAGR